MKKICSIAWAEFLQAVRSKAFLLGLFLMPVMMGGSLVAHILLDDQVDLTERRCAVVDPTGELWPALEAAAAQRNAEGIWEIEDPDGEGGGERVQRRPVFVLERFEPTSDERPEVTLSERVRSGELLGFLLIAPGVIDAQAELPERPLAYHTKEPTFTELPNWLRDVINRRVRRQRFAAADLDLELIDRLDRRLPLSTWGLTELRDDGSVDEAEKQHKGRTFGVPAAAMMLMFMLVMISAPQLMNQVLEEKMQRISEVLVSAVSPFELMMGKLVGSVLVSLTLAAVYLGGIVWATNYWGVSDLVQPSVYAWFLLLLVLALLMYGSLFSALGAACSELRDAQSMMMPAMILILIPMFAWGAILESPNGPVAQALTFFPSATPMVLLLRVVAPPGPPPLETLLAVLLCLATTVLFVWASGKIFRVGVLAQGQAPSFKKLLGWVFAK